MAEEVRESNAAREGFFREVVGFIREKNPRKQALSSRKILLCRKYGLREIPTDIQILLNADGPDVEMLKQRIQTKPMRTGSGVAVVAVMTKPGCCPHGRCIYCPGGVGSAFGDVPQSYTGNEPAAMRGRRNNYDSYLQVMSRLEQYVAIGQSPEKVDLIILGGTFLAVDKEYQDDFVRDAYQAMNDFSSEFYAGGSFDVLKFKEFFELPGDIRSAERSASVQGKLLLLKERKLVPLGEAQLQNETSRIRCIGLTIETRPDWGLLAQGGRMLELGCTRVELGVQTLYDDVLKKINRGHTLEDSRKSIRALKDIGFKLNFHVMLGLPGVGMEKDIECFREIFDNPDYRPDMLKVYPTMVMPGTPLAEMYARGEYAPLSAEQAVDIISEALRFVPRYCRVMRVQRDIPSKFAEGGSAKNNLRQLVSAAMKAKGYAEQDIRAREIGDGRVVPPVDFEVIEYGSSGGKEFFIGLADANDRLLGFARLRFPSGFLRSEITPGAGIVRELHVYGKSLPLAAGGEGGGFVQHRGYGRMLLAKAEEIAKSGGKDKLVVISGVGAREYYRKLGYSKEGPYMVKLLF